MRRIIKKLKVTQPVLFETRFRILRASERLEHLRLVELVLISTALRFIGPNMTPLSKDPTLLAPIFVRYRLFTMNHHSGRLLTRPFVTSRR